MRVYLSNIRPQWPVERQEALLDERVPEWRKASIYTDTLSRAAIKRKSDLQDRNANLLRSTTRMVGDDLYVASITVLAWTPTDLMTVLLRLAGRHDRLHCLAEALDIEPGSEKIEEVRKAFLGAMRRFSAVGVSGGKASGQKRMDDAKAKCEQIRPYWALPSSEYPTAELCRRVGISRPTAFLYLGKRKDAQRERERADATAERNRQRKERGAEYRAQAKKRKGKRR